MKIMRTTILFGMMPSLTMMKIQKRIQKMIIIREITSELGVSGKYALSK
jgi:hypothetical protein